MAIRFLIESKNQNAYNFDYYVPLSQSQDLEELRNFKITPEPAAVVRDKFGNSWALIQGRNVRGSTEVRVEFEMLAAESLVTFDPAVVFSEKDFPADLLVNQTSETYSFNFSHPVFARILPALKREVAAEPNYYRKIQLIENATNDLLRIRGPSGPESQASEFVRQGVGRCYAHTIVFATLARAVGIPTRAAAGMWINNNVLEVQDDPAVHTYNQVYLPGTGWIDVDAVADDSDKEPKSNRSIGLHYTGMWRTFYGDYDRADFQRVFTQRGWIDHFTCESVDESRKADVDAKGFVIRTEILPAW